MNLNEYRRSVSKKIYEEVFCRVNHWGNHYILRPMGNTSIYDIKTWLDKNKDILQIQEIYQNRIDAELINFEKYKDETEKEKITKYDKEIEKLETKLRELKTLQKLELEQRRKNKKINELKKQLEELEGK